MGGFFQPHFERFSSTQLKPVLRGLKQASMPVLRG